MIHLSGGGRSGLVTETENGHIKSDFLIPQIGQDVAASVARRLGAVYVDEVSLESELTKNITLFELLSIANVDDLDLGKRWKQSKVYKSMAAPLGVKRKNEIVNLDISGQGQGSRPSRSGSGNDGLGKERDTPDIRAFHGVALPPLRRGIRDHRLQGRRYGEPVYGSAAPHGHHHQHRRKGDKQIPPVHKGGAGIPSGGVFKKRSQPYNDYIKLYKNGKVKSRCRI